MTINGQTINDLKSAGHYFVAGTLAYQLGQPKQYGCHFGMKSELDYAKQQFNAGWDAASFA